MFQPKLIVTDLDGSALRNDKTLSKNTINAFAKCHQAGIPIAIATARYIMGAKPFAEALHADYQILTDGTLIYQNDELIYSNTMSLDTTNGILQELYRHGYTSHIAIPTAYGLFRYPEGEKVPLSLQQSPDTEETPSDTTSVKVANQIAKAKPNSSEIAFQANEKGNTIGYHFEIDKPFPYPANKMVVEIPNETTAAKIAEKYSCSQFRYRGENRYTFFHPTASKLNAIRFITDKLGITLDDVLVFGDDINDIEMISHCGWGVAMGNAIEEVKVIADEVTDTNEEDGIAKVLRKYAQF